MLYSSRSKVNLDKESEITGVDANSYSGFKVVDSLIVKRITDELEALGEPEEEGQLSAENTPILSSNKFA
jgi:hypothetical protein